jgi:hypothetical protein
LSRFSPPPSPKRVPFLAICAIQSRPSLPGGRPSPLSRPTRRKKPRTYARGSLKV